MEVRPGTVKWWVDDNGVIADDNGKEDVEVHRSVLESCGYLKAGEKVLYTAIAHIATAVGLTEQTVMNRDRDAAAHARAFMSARRLADLLD